MISSSSSSSPFSVTSQWSRCSPSPSAPAPRHHKIAVAKFSTFGSQPVGDSHEWSLPCEIPYYRETHGIFLSGVILETQGSLYVNKKHEIVGLQCHFWGIEFSWGSMLATSHARKSSLQPLQPLPSSTDHSNLPKCCRKAMYHLGFGGIFVLFSLFVDPQFPKDMFWKWGIPGFPNRRAMDFTKSYGRDHDLDDLGLSPWLWKPPFTDLVGGWATPLKNMKVNWDDWKPNTYIYIYIYIYIWENKKWHPNHQPEIFITISNIIIPYIITYRQIWNDCVWKWCIHANSHFHATNSLKTMYSHK